MESPVRLIENKKSRKRASYLRRERPKTNFRRAGVDQSNDENWSSFKGAKSTRLCLGTYNEAVLREKTSDRCLPIKERLFYSSGESSYFPKENRD